MYVIHFADLKLSILQSGLIDQHQQRDFRIVSTEVVNRNPNLETF